MLFFRQITKLLGGKCARNQTLDMKWIKIALEYCNLALISSLEQKKQAILNVEYEIVLRTRVFLKMKNPFLWAGLRNLIVSMYEEPKY